MTPNSATANMTPEEMAQAVEFARDVMRRRIEEIDEAKERQSERLAHARSEAEEARGWALLEEPLDGQVTSLDIDGTASLSLPNITARELWGARLAFDVLDAGDDYDQIDAVIGRLFSAANGDPGLTMVIMSAALSTIAGLIAPELLYQIEHQGSNYDERVRLCEARAKAWRGRVSEIRELNDDLADHGVKPIDGFDIGAAALDDPDEPEG